MQIRSQSITTIYYFSICLVLFLLCSSCTQKHKRIPIKPGECYSGYSAGFQEIKHDLYNGDDKKILQRLDERDAELKTKHKYDDSFAQDMGMLNLLENSSLYLQTDCIEKSLEYSQHAECLIEQRDDEAIFSSGVRKAGTIFGQFFGVEEYAAYDPIGYEKVLLLNIQAMNYLLKGDDRAFNVARKSTMWQELEQDKFEKDLEEIKDIKPDTNTERLDITRRNQIFSRLAKEFSKYDKKALKVPSAFVNPFGDYLAGVVKEFKSVELKSQKDSARIHYEKALKLNPSSRVLQLAVKDMKNKRSATRLVQIVAFDGFVPEKKILSFDIHLKNCKIPIHIEVPLYDSVKSKVHKIVASTTAGKMLATFRPVADIEALALRHQKDMLPAVQALVAVAAVRDATIATAKQAASQSIDKKFRNNAALAGAFQGLLGAISEGLDAGLEPDTSSWMSLPSRIMAARFHPAKNVKKIRITSYDVKGKQLNRQTVQLGEGGRTFIFVRSLDNRLKAIPGKKIWSPKERKPVTICER